MNALGNYNDENTQRQGSVAKMNFFKKVIFLFLAFSHAEELERDTRGLDSQSFKALLEIGRLISNFGVDNIEGQVHGFVGVVGKNVIVFYFLLFASLMAHFVTWSFTIIAIRNKKIQNSIQMPIPVPDNVTGFSYDTNEREYFPPKISDITFTPVTYV